MQFGKAFDKKELKHLQKYFSFIFLITIDFLLFGDKTARSTGGCSR